MKIQYEFENKKMVQKCLNRFLGILLFKNRVKKKKNIKTIFQTFGSLLGQILLCVFLIGLSSDFFKTDVFNTLLVLVLFILSILLLLLVGYYVYNKIKRPELSGEIRFSPEGITKTSIDGKQRGQNWQSIRFIVIEEDFICICTKRNNVCLPYTKNNEEIIKEAVQEYNPQTDIIRDLKEENGFKRFFKSIGIYIILCVMILFFSIGFDTYNLDLLNKEIEKMNLYHKVDDRIYSYQKYGIVEKYLKNFFSTCYKYEDNYREYSAEGTLEAIITNLLKENFDYLSTVSKNLKLREKMADEALTNLLDLYDKEKSKREIALENLGEYYDELFLNYVYTEENNNSVKYLQEERYINVEKMKHLEELINLLLSNKESWLVKDGELYFYEENLLEKYNELFETISKKKEFQKISHF